MSTDYVIISKPNEVEFVCPECGNDVRIPFSDVDYKTGLWSDGGLCECPECGEEVELDDYEYD